MRGREKWLAERGVAKLNLMVRKGNEGVLTFYYKALGHEEGEVVVLGRSLDRELLPSSSGAARR